MSAPGRPLSTRAGHEPQPIEPVISEADGYRRFHPANNLVEVIQGQAENGSPAEVGWRAVETLDAAYRSASQEGQPISTIQLYQLGQSLGPVCCPVILLIKFP